MKIHALILTALSLSTATSRAEDWPQFRGPNGGNYTGTKLPTEWGPDKNVAWQTPISGKGWSSPIVSKGKVYLTTADLKGKDYSLQAIRVDAKTGKIDWQKEVFLEPAGSPNPHSKNSHASPTPITDGVNLFVHFGHMGTAALDLNGKILWKNSKITYKPVHGNGGSPILAGDNLVFSVDGGDQQFIIALKKKTGDVAWKTDRKSKATQPFSFSTPLLIKVGSQEQIISPASGFVGAYDPKTGAELWRVMYPVAGYSVIPQPIFGNGLIYLSTSYNEPLLLAVKPDGKGDVTKSNLVWQQKKGAPHTPTSVLVGEELYSLSDKIGLLTCLNAKTGDVYWSERVAPDCSASLMHADGKIYLTNETGTGVVVAASKDAYKEIARSEMKEKTFATFAAVDGALYLRTETKLFRFEQK